MISLYIVLYNHFFFFCTGVPVDARIGDEVGTLMAVNQENQATAGFLFSILPGSLLNRNVDTRASNPTPAPQTTFSLGMSSGVLATTILMSAFEEQYFVVGVTVAHPDGPSSVPSDAYVSNV